MGTMQYSRTSTCSRGPQVTDLFRIPSPLWILTNFYKSLLIYINNFIIILDKKYRFRFALTSYCDRTAIVVLCWSHQIREVNFRSVFNALVDIGYHLPWLRRCASWLSSFSCSMRYSPSRFILIVEYARHDGLQKKSKWYGMILSSISNARHRWSPIYRLDTTVSLTIPGEYILFRGGRIP